jgi:broad specificity phosphatase PhoE
MALIIWLVRHGETHSNRDGVFQGHLDIELNERGEEQARRVGEYLAGVRFDAVYASDLQRAAHTARLIAGDCVDVTLDPDLREMHYGVLQGVRYREAHQALEPHGLAEQWSSGEFHRRGLALPGGESLRRFRSRSSRFVGRLERAHPPDEDHQVLVVAHGGKLAVLLTVLLGLPGRYRHAFRFANCSITRLTRGAHWTMLDFHNLVVWDGTWPTGTAPVRAHSAGEHEATGMTNGPEEASSAR